MHFISFHQVTLQMTDFFLAVVGWFPVCDLFTITKVGVWDPKPWELNDIGAIFGPVLHGFAR